MKALISKDTPKNPGSSAVFPPQSLCLRQKQTHFSHFSSPSGLRDLHLALFWLLVVKSKCHQNRVNEYEKKTIEPHFISIFFTIINQKKKKLRKVNAHTHKHIYVYIFKFKQGYKMKWMSLILWNANNNQAEHSVQFLDHSLWLLPLVPLLPSPSCFHIHVWQDGFPGHKSGRPFVLAKEASYNPSVLAYHFLFLLNLRSVIRWRMCYVHRYTTWTQ